MLNNEHILVTGASKRVGLSLATFFQSLGATVTRTHRHTAPPKGARSHQADLTDPDAVTAVMELIGDKGPPLTTLIHNASIFYPTPIESCSPSDWDVLIATNLTSTHIISLAFRNQVQGDAHLIYIVDSYAERGFSHHAPYAAAKIAQLGLMKQLIKEWRPRIRINAISPGLILFPDNFGANDDSNYDAPMKESLTGQVPLGMGDPQDICEAARFLIQNGYCNGLCLRVNGGL